MSAIGGRVDFFGREADMNSILRMSKAMSLRGCKRSSSYIGEGVGIIFNSSSPDAFCKNEDCQPAIYERAGKVYVLSVDGEANYSSAIFEKYRTDGIDFLAYLKEPFAVSLYDGDRKMLLLARDREGRKPLFYRILDRTLYFASEIKGILAATEERLAVKREMFSLHLSAPMGVYRSSNLFCDIREVLPGECLLFTGLGMSRFRYRERQGELRGARSESRKRTCADEPLKLYYECSREEIDDALCEALIAFDHPQFDARMVALCKTLSDAAREGRHSLSFEDAIFKKSRSYAYERADRLGGLYGVDLRGFPMRLEDEDGEVYPMLLKIRAHLRARVERLSSAELSFLGGIVGEKKLCYLLSRLCGEQKGGKEREERKEDTESEIRILGMLCQTAEWATSQKLIFRSFGDGLAQSALSTI